MSILKILIGFLIQMLCFFQLGYLVKATLLKHHDIYSYSEQLVIGFLSYFSLFQLIALPMILLKMKLSVLTVVWGMIMLILLIIPFVFRDYRERFPQIKFRCDIVLTIAIFLVLYQVIYAVMYQSIGWDTLSYIGRINAALETDTMFLYTGDEGIPYAYINFKHILSTYYMNSAVFCQILHLPGFLFQKYVGGSICIIVANLVVYVVTGKIFSREIALWSVVFLSFIRFFFHTWATTDTFFLTRSLEAKAYCGNIILPLIFGVCIMIWKDYKDTYSWKLLFLAAMSSLPISMSAILLAPALIACMIFSLFLVKFDKVILGRMIICLIPNGFWCFLYFLYTLNIIQIQGVAV